MFCLKTTASQSVALTVGKVKNGAQVIIGDNDTLCNIMGMKTLLQHVSRQLHNTVATTNLMTHRADKVHIDSVMFSFYSAFTLWAAILDYKLRVGQVTWSFRPEITNSGFNSGDAAGCELKNPIGSAEKPISKL